MTCDKVRSVKHIKDITVILNFGPNSVSSHKDIMAILKFCLNSVFSNKVTMIISNSFSKNVSEEL